MQSATGRGGFEFYRPAVWNQERIPRVVRPAGPLFFP